MYVGTILSALTRLDRAWERSIFGREVSASLRARECSGGRKGGYEYPRKRIYISRRRIIAETSDAEEGRERNWNNKNCGVYAAQYRRIYCDVKAVASIFPYNMPRESFSMARALTSMFSPIYPSWNVTARVLWQSNTVVFKMAGFTRVTGCGVVEMCPSPLGRWSITRVTASRRRSLFLFPHSPRGLG